MRFLRAALGWVGYALLGVLALAGLALSLLGLLATSPRTRPFIARTLIHFADEALAGSFSLDAIAVLPAGGVELRGLRVLDPDGHLVLEVGRAQVSADLTRLRRRVIGLTLEAEGASVLIEEERGGGVSLARAFAPSHPSPPRPPGEPEPPSGGGGGWRLAFQRVALRGADLWWVDAAGATRLELQGVDLDARGVAGPGLLRAGLRVTGALDLPVSAPVSLEVRAAMDGTAVRVGVLRARLGDTSLEGLGELDLATRRGRLALGRLTVDRDEVHALVPQLALGGDLDASAYLEADGKVATGAVHVAPRTQGAAAGGRAEAAVAVRLDGARALGADVAVDRLDPSRLHARAPRGEVTLSAHGGAAGADLDTLRGQVAVSLSRSRLGGAELGPGELTARAGDGRLELQRLALAAPGLSAQAAGSWRRQGTVGGQVAIDAGDLARAARNLEALLGAKLPPLRGRARLAGTLSGTAAQPALDATVNAPVLGEGALAVSGLRAGARVSGTLRDPAARLDASADGVSQGGRLVARALRLRGNVGAAEARLEGSAEVPSLGRDPVSLLAVAQRTSRRDELVLRELTLSYPGTRYALAVPTRVWLSGPRVDRLALASGAQRIAVEGGVGARDALDLRLSLVEVRLEGLPAGLLPADEQLGGVVTAELTVAGTTRRPHLSGRYGVAGGRWRTLEGLTVTGDLRWDGSARRAGASVALARAAGGTADVAVDLPVPLGGRPGEPVSARVRAEALPLEPLLAAARADVPATGTLSLQAKLSGTAGAPALDAEATLADGSYQDLQGLRLTARAEAPGERVSLHAEASVEGAQALKADAEVPVDLSDLLSRPAEALRALRRAPFVGSAEVPVLDLRLVSGRLGLPDGLAGGFAAEARLSGTLSAPRGTAWAELREAALEGYSGVAARVEVSAGPDRVALAARAALRGQEVLHATGTLAAPLERLATPEGLRGTTLALEAVVPHVTLARTATASVLVEGTLDGRLTGAGTLGAPRLSLELDGKRLAVQGRPLGDLAARARWAGARADARLDLTPQAGGTLEATLGVDLPLTIDVRAAQARAAPAVLEVRARALALGFLPAAAPGVIREASGTLDAEVTARGPLAHLSPRGTVRVADGRVAVSEYGDWTGIEVQASVTDDAVEITRLAARRAHGTVEAQGALRGLSRGQGRLEGKLTTRSLSVMRAGMELATLDLQLSVTGGYRSGRLDVEVQGPTGTVRLPKRTPRTLQSLERRGDIVVGRREPRRAVVAVAAGGEAPPLVVSVHAVVPGRLQVVSDNPRIRLELKADVTFELEGGEQYARGTMEVVRGEVEPLGGRNFQVEHAKVTFTGGPPSAALLDVEATYQNPSARITAVVTGPLRSPEFRLTSQPPMEEAQIAMLIATGTSELKPGAGGVGTLTGEEAGKAALGAVATQVFKNLVADKLPLDTVALDSSSLRAGKYVTDRVYVGYTRRLDVQLEEGVNRNEVRVEYQITRRWSFESRYGDAQSGGASLIWSKNY